MQNQTISIRCGYSRLAAFMESPSIRIHKENPLMFANYCTIALRHLRKNGLYVFINILSLGIGIAAMIWGVQVYRFNSSYDHFHRNRDHIYRVLINVAGGDGLKGTCPAPLAAAAARDEAGVQAAVRFYAEFI